MTDITSLFIIPFLASIGVFFTRYMSRINARYFVFILSFIPLAFLLFGWRTWIGQEVNLPWIPSIGINFHLKIDSIALVFLFLTAIVIPFSLFAISIDSFFRLNGFYFLILFLEGLLFGFFMARDLALFTIFWEAMLIPLYFIISIWGGENRSQVAIKFLIYMITGSTLMIAAVLALYFSTIHIGVGTFNMNVLAQYAKHMPYAFWIASIFFLAFSVKTPLFPLHGWLPDSYSEAPYAGTILLSALLSKAGIYGFIRIGNEIFSEQMREWSPLLLGLAIAGVIYASLCAWMQNEYKRLISFSSLAHVNFILAGLFVWNLISRTGSIIQAFNHGITITALFLVAGWLQERIHTKEFGLVTGAARQLPHLCWLTLFFVLSSVALPGMNNFVGELMILLGVFSANYWLAGILGTSIILSVVYMLRWMQSIYFGSGTHSEFINKDISWNKVSLMLPLIFLILWVGIYPYPIVKVIEMDVKLQDPIISMQELP